MTNRKTNTLALDAANAKHKVRLIDFEAGEYLHMSGVGTTKKLDWAWLGFAKQAEVLKQRAEERGESWPFRTIHRSPLEQPNTHG